MISLPTILYIPLWWFIADTPRWYLRKGRVDEAVGIIKHAIAVNNKKHPMPEQLELRQHLMKYMELSSKEEPPAKWHSLWDDRGTVVSIIAVHFAWAVYVTNYSGMLLNVRAFGREHLSFNTSILGEYFLLFKLYWLCETVFFYWFDLKFGGGLKLVFFWRT